MPADRGLLGSLAALGGLTALPSHGSHRQVPSRLSSSPSEEWAKAPVERKQALFFCLLWVTVMLVNVWNHTSFWHSSTCEEEQTETKMYDFRVLYISWNAPKVWGWLQRFSFEFYCRLPEPCLLSEKLSLIAEDVSYLVSRKNKRHVYRLSHSVIHA